MTVQEHLRAGGRLAHVKDKNGRRIVTIAYREGPTVELAGALTRTLLYGACVFTAYEASYSKFGVEKWRGATQVFTKAIRQGNSETAVQRLAQYQVVVPDPVTDEDLLTLKGGQIDYQRRTYLREQVKRLGVCYKVEPEPGPVAA